MQQNTIQYRDEKGIIVFTESDFGGKYRAEITTPNLTHTYVTDNEGSGLFFLNGRGDRRQIAGTGQFHAQSIASFSRQIMRRVRA